MSLPTVPFTGLLLLLAISFPAQGAQPPNIVWIIADDLSLDLGCYGGQAITPRLDALAAQSIRYTHAFTTAAVCSTSRSAMITGMNQISIGAHHMLPPQHLATPLPEPVTTLPQLLRKAGYTVGNVVSFPQEANVSASGKDHFAFRFQPEEMWDTRDWKKLVDHQPFFSMVCLNEPHRGGGWSENDTASPQFDPKEAQLPPYYPDHSVSRESWASYCNATNVLDRKVGLILDQIERDGLADNTVVMFFSDHGRPFLRGKYWLYDSGTRIPLLVRLPPALRPIGQGSLPRVEDRLVSAIDITATTLALAGVQVPRWMQGRPFLGECSSPQREYVFSATDRIGEVHLQSRSVRSRQYRYIRNRFPELSIHKASTAHRRANHPIYHVLQMVEEKGELTPEQAALLAPRSAEELYDLNADPHELHNLANSSEHKRVLADLRRTLDHWLRSGRNVGQPEDSAEIIQFFEEYGKEKRANAYYQSLERKIHERIRHAEDAG